MNVISDYFPLRHCDPWDHPRHTSLKGKLVRHCHAATVLTVGSQLELADGMPQFTIVM